MSQILRWLKADDYSGDARLFAQFCLQDVNTLTLTDKSDELAYITAIKSILSRLSDQSMPAASDDNSQAMSSASIETAHSSATLSVETHATMASAATVKSSLADIVPRKMPDSIATTPLTDASQGMAESMEQSYSVSCDDISAHDLQALLEEQMPESYGDGQSNTEQLSERAQNQFKDNS